jgi:hypothetical protein
VRYACRWFAVKVRRARCFKERGCRVWVVDVESDWLTLHLQVGRHNLKEISHE